MYTSFMNNQVPALWTRVSFASLKSLASWNKDLLFRWDASVQSRLSVYLVYRRGLGSMGRRRSFVFRQPGEGTLSIDMTLSQACWNDEHMRIRQ